MDMCSCVSTSSGLSHVYIHPQRLDTHSCMNAPLPPSLYRQEPGPVHYSITSHTQHDPKPVDGVLGNEVYSKASPHWHTHFLNDLAHTLRASRSFRYVSAPPVSEMQDQYRGHSAPYQPLQPHYRDLHGRLHHSSVLLPKEPALSTTHTDYRRFKRSELASVSASDTSPTRGPFPHLIHLPPVKAPPSVMHRPSVPVPHGGRSSVYTDTFRVPVHPPVSSTQVAVLAETKHTDESGRSLLQHILDVPHMYSTENRTYGKERIVLVI
ncbi:stabilizer of axonemal microtubules 3 [Clarias gariepinus]|uniref:uncharacterized protein zgc:193811 n=1 Tax=Clarias gariepinus TaxID=13013 RepID=UPI00234C14F4|nr:uncharacterized protein zgc:193811 [Clarias gariepinus]